MSIPKPGQIRCPTCLKATPPAAFCTQCGAPLPPSSLARPRGLDREELEERVRRRPAEGFRRGSGGEDAARPGYAPFAPEPEDSLALRQEEEEAAAAERRVDNLPPDEAAGGGGTVEQEPMWTPPPRPERWPAGEPEEPVPAAPRPGAQQEDYQYPPEAYDDISYAEPEEAYPYPYQADDRRRGGGGGGALPIIGFVALCVLALAVGAVLAGLLGSDDGVAQATPTPSTEASAEPSTEASVEPSGAPSSPAEESSPPPGDGPVTFPDGGLLTIQPCATNGWREEAVGRPEEMACEVDGSTDDDGDVWAMVVFNGIDGSDRLAVLLRSNGETVDEKEQVLNSLVSCGADCNGLIIGDSYRGLDPGQYELVVNRNGEFADSAEFVVEG